MQRLRVLLRILFNFDPTTRLDLFATFPLIRRFFADRRYLAAVRTFGDIAFTCLILIGLFGPQDPDRNVALFLAWGFWWAGVVLSWFFVGKLWCGVCPFPGGGRLLQRFGLSLNLDPPLALRRYFIYVAICLFASIIWAESVTDLKHRPFGTALLLLAILSGATIMGFLYKGQAWCRFFCPLGKIIGTGATMSMIELRANPDLCRTCGSFSCSKGRDGLLGCPIYLGAHNVKNSRDCLLCGRCVLLCESDAPHLLLRNPFVELVANRGRDLTCSFTIPFLAGSQWARFIQESHWYKIMEPRFFFSPKLSFTLLLTGCVMVFIGIVKLGNRQIDLPRSNPTDRCSPMIPILTPLAFSGELIYRLQYLLPEAGRFPAVFGRQFGFAFEDFAFTMPPHLQTAISVLLLVLGSLGSMYVTRLFRQQTLNDPLRCPSCQAAQILVGLASLGYLFLII